MERVQLVADVEGLTKALGQLPEPVVKPALVVVSGLPGTGKSHFCTKLAEKLPFITLESDSLRKSLFRSPTYSPVESARLFGAIHLLIGRLLKNGVPVILDATNLSERYRERLYSIAEHLNAKLVLVQVEAPTQLVQERLKVRQEAKSSSSSDADWEVYQRMKPTVEKIRRNHYVVDTSRDITAVLEKIAREVKR